MILSRFVRRAAAILLAPLAFIAAHSAAQPLASSPLSPPPNGMRHAEPAAHTLINATVHVAPGRTLTSAAVIIRDGRIDAVHDLTANPAFTPPPGSRVWDCTGLHIYPGFIDAYVEVDAPRPDFAAPGVHWSTRVTPQRSALDGEGLPSAAAESLRRLGFTAAAIAPRGGVFRGQAAVVSLARPADARSADRPPVYSRAAYQSVAFDTTPIRLPGADASNPDVQRWTNYPDSQMGAIALIRQTLLDAQWQAAARNAGKSIAPNALDALFTVLAPTEPIPAALRHAAPPSLLLFNSENELEFLRAARIAAEFNARAAILGSGTEFARLRAIAQQQLPIILPINFPRPPDVASLARADATELKELMTWEQAPTNPRRLDAQGLTVALTTAKLRDRAQFRDNLTNAMKHGLAPDRALAMLTTNPAELLGVADRLGTIEPGKIASLVVADGDLFNPWPAPSADQPADKTADTSEQPQTEPKPADPAEPAQPSRDLVDAPADQPPADAAQTPAARSTPAAQPKAARIRDVWIDGIRHEINPAPQEDAHGTWVITRVDDRELDPAAPDAITFIVKQGDVTFRRTPQGQTAPKTVRVRNLRAVGSRLAWTVDMKDLVGIEGTMVDNATLTGENLLGVTLMPDGSIHRWVATRISRDTDTPRTPRPARPNNNNPDANQPQPPQPQPPQPQPPQPQPPQQQPRKSDQDRQREAIAQIPETLGHPFGPYMRADIPEQPAALLIKNATIWTANPKDEIIESGGVLIRAGIIDAVLTADALANLPHIPGLVVVDATGKHVTPGIIDCHSHTGISRGVNESGQAITAEVRIADVTDPDAISWYRQLAAGVTTVNSLHGSANAIGGQSQTSKIRWGAIHPDDMHLKGGRPGIKFALGENPKQSNWGDRNTNRYPQTRMGVETIIVDRLIAAREYAAARLASPLTRRDLELEALAEVLTGHRLIHCHAYRQDEILMLCRVARDFGFKIGTFQHVLEGYKVADELARITLGASAFSDWWAFKVEVQDAIPQAGPIMHEQGVVVSYNSDSDELARRMNGEAAKAIKYAAIDPATGQPNISPSQALKFVTLNPAIQLGIDHLTGSIEPGKHADIAIWSGDPLSSMTRCVATYIDGRRYFSIQDDADARDTIRAQRQRLIQKVLSAPPSAREPASAPPAQGGIRGPWQRPTHEDSSAATAAADDTQAAATRARYLRMLNRGLDPSFHDCGECGMVHRP